jgi:hypothetical protein
MSGFSLQFVKSAALCSAPLIFSNVWKQKDATRSIVADARDPFESARECFRFFLCG